MLCAADVRALFVFKTRDLSHCGNSSANSDVRLKWGSLEPGRSKFSLQAGSLNEAYQLMQDQGLVPVPPDCQVGSVGTKQNGYRYFASGFPLPECPSQTKGLVTAAHRKPEGKEDDGSCVFFGREPWQMTVYEGDGKKWTWPLIKMACPNLPSGLRDGKNEANEPLSGPCSSTYIPKKSCSDPAKVINIIKRKRKKRMTEAKRLQFLNPKLFKNGQKGKTKKKKRKCKRKSREWENTKEQNAKMQPKKSKNKYVHHQEMRRWKKLENGVCTLDLAAEVMMIMMIMMIIVIMIIIMMIMVMMTMKIS